MNSSDKSKTLKEKANKLPLTPGVYIMKNKLGEVIYVGKAKKLKNRVTQYFGSSQNHTEKVKKMVNKVDAFETIMCDTEYEALMLENSLIKQYQPKYNILLKDDKGYHYIKITNERWPKIEAVKNFIKDGSEYIGPYYSGHVVSQTVDEALKVFKLPNCNRCFDKKSKPCLNFHIGICSAPCNGKQAHTDYLDTINSAKEYIKKGGADDFDIKCMREKMNEAANALDFENAAKLRDRIITIEKSRQKQKIINSNHKREDVFAVAMAGEMACVGLLIFVGGVLTGKKLFFLDGEASKQEYYAQLLQQYYQTVNDIPPEIVLDCDFEDSNLISEWLTEVKGSRVKISVPKQGQQKKLVEMCLSNAAQALSDKIQRSGKETAAINELADLLGLKSVPRRIEAYDISNTAGSENVGAMIVFIDGRPVKSLYRKFRVKSFVGQDDFRSLNEILDRRLKEYVKGDDESFCELPDLILLDGGKGQISSVKPIFDKHNLDIALFGMVKDSKHKTRAITAGGDDIQIKANRRAYTLVTNIQDEVHRVAISYHHKRSSISTLQLELTKIPGVGEKTARKLMDRFKSIKNIKNASIEEIMEKGFSVKVANNIQRYYKK